MTFENQDVQIEFFYSELDTFLGEPLVVTVGDGIENAEASSELDEDNGFIIGYSIDLANNSIIYQTDEISVDNPFFLGGDFNGVIFTNVSNSIPDIEAVSIDRTTTTLDVDDSDIEFTENTISLNLEGITYTPGDLVELDVEFEALETIPEPDGVIQGQNLVVDSTGTVGSINLVTGELTEILDTDLSLTDIDIDADGKVFGVSFSQLYSLNLDAGTTTLIGSHGGGDINALEISEDGTLYATSSSSQDVFTLDPDTGIAASIGALPDGISSAGDLQFIDDTLYLADLENLVALDVSEDTLNDTTVVGSFGLEDELIFGITVDEDGDPLGLTEDGNILEFDLDTGTATSIGTIANRTTIFGAAELSEVALSDLSRNNSEGSSIQLQAFSPDLDSPVSEAVTATIGEGIEFRGLPADELSGAPFENINVDLDFGTETGTIAFEVDDDGGFGRFDEAEVNSYVFTDISNQIAAIENVTIDESANTLGLEADDITFSANSIEVNVENLAYVPGSNALLNIEFADM